MYSHCVGQSSSSCSSLRDTSKAPSKTPGAHRRRSHPHRNYQNHRWQDPLSAACWHRWKRSFHQRNRRGFDKRSHRHSSPFDEGCPYLSTRENDSTLQLSAWGCQRCVYLSDCSFTSWASSWKRCGNSFSQEKVSDTSQVSFISCKFFTWWKGLMVLILLFLMSFVVSAGWREL